MFEIHASTLPTYADCGLSWAAYNIEEIRNDCLKARDVEKGKAFSTMGAAFGKACHVGGLSMIESKQEGLGLEIEESIDLAKTFFKALLQETTVPIDDVTKDLFMGLGQIDSCLRAFANGYGIHAKPLLVNHKMRMELVNGIWLCGETDVIQEGYQIDDPKFGKDFHPYQAQMGTYIRLLLDLFGDIEIPDPRLIWTRRASLKRPQPATRIITYPYESCVETSFYQTGELIKKLKQWQSERKKRYWIFPANPRSKSCRKSGCIAWGTDTCDQWIDLDEQTEITEAEWATW